MKKSFIPVFAFWAYSALLIKVMVCKDLPTIRIGQLMFNFGGTDGGHPANFVPFTTIVPYLFGNQGLVIAGVNLLGNVALLVPIGLLAPFVFKRLTWKKSLTLAIATGLTIEVMQAVLRLGIFDIDDVILNALGVITGYGAYLILVKWIRSKSYKNIVLAAALIVIMLGASLYALYPKDPVVKRSEGVAPTSGDLCGGTKGTGQVVAIGSKTITIKRNDNSLQTINLTSHTAIKTSRAIASKAELREGDRVTVIIDDTETASDILVCGISN